MNIRFVSLISRNNSPLYIQAFVPETDSNNTNNNSNNNNNNNDDSNNDNEDHDSKTPKTTPNQMNELLKYNFLSHMSLDVFESPFAPIGLHSSQGKPTLLFIQDGILVYGSETHTGLKVVIGCSRYDNFKNSKIKQDSASIAAKNIELNGLANLEGFSDTDIVEVSELDRITSLIRKEYLKYSCNPFLVPGEETEIKSDKFDKNIKNIVDEFNSNKS